MRAHPVRVCGRAPAEYYVDASSGRLLHAVAVPMLLLCAEDDPVCCATGIPVATVMGNPNLAGAAGAGTRELCWRVCALPSFCASVEVLMVDLRGWVCPLCVHPCGV